MKKRFAPIIYTQDDLIEVVETVDTTINKDVLPNLTELIKVTEGKTELSENVLFNTLNLKDDSIFFKRVETVVKKYVAILQILKSKISDELSDTVTSNTHNVNTKIAFALISEGIFLSTELIRVINYLTGRYYSEEPSDLDPKVKQQLSHQLIILVKIIPELEKANFKQIVDTIGQVPTLKTLRYEETSTIPTELVLDFFKDTFKIKDFYTTTLLKRFLGYFHYKEEKKTHKDISRSFIGNPLYHIQLLIIDLQSLRLASIKNDARITELRILELKNNAEGKPDAEINKAIKYYEEKANKLNLKIKKLSEIR